MKVVVNPTDTQGGTVSFLVQKNKVLEAENAKLRAACDRARHILAHLPKDTLDEDWQSGIECGVEQIEAALKGGE